MLHGTCVCNVFWRSLGDPSLRFLQRQILFFWSLDCDFAKQMSVGLGCPRQIKVCIQYASLSILGKPNMIASTSVHCGNGEYPSLKDNLFSVIALQSIWCLGHKERKPAVVFYGERWICLQVFVRVWNCPLQTLQIILSKLWNLLP